MAVTRHEARATPASPTAKRRDARSVCPKFCWCFLDELMLTVGSSVLLAEGGTKTTFKRNYLAVYSR